MAYTKSPKNGLPGVHLGKSPRGGGGGGGGGKSMLEDILEGGGACI